MTAPDAPRPPAEGAESLGLYQECPHYAAAKGVRPTARSVRVYDHCPDCAPPWKAAPPITAAERADAAPTVAGTGEG